MLRMPFRQAQERVAAEECEMSGIDLRRRNFFKTSMGAAAVAIAPGILLFDTAYGKPPAGAGDGKVRWGMLIDTTQCREGCSDCVTACNKENGLPGGTGATAVQWIRKVEIKEVSAGRKMALRKIGRASCRERV